METYKKVINERELAKTIDYLDTANSDIIAALKNKEAAYKNKADLMKKLRQLETEIELEEAEAIMKIQGESSRSQYVIINGEKFPLTNDTTREAYMKSASKELRRELGKIKADLAKIDIELEKANDYKFEIKEVADNIRAKAGLQASLLEYLSNTCLIDDLGTGNKG